MAVVEFFPIEVNYRILNGKAVVHLYGRTRNEEQICVQDENFRPYFYIELKEDSDSEIFLNKVSSLEVEKNDEKAVVTGTEFVDKKILGKERSLIKVFANLPNLVPALREEIKNIPEVRSVYEADIPFVRRYLIDKEIFPMTITRVEGGFINAHSKVPVLKASDIKQVSEEHLMKPRILAIDIETYNPTLKINMQSNPIIMIAFYGEGFRKVLTWKRFETKEDYVEFVEDETALLEKTKKIIESFAPDIITGYFSDTFDWPYIKARADKLKVKMDLGLDHSFLKTSLRSETTEITGICNLDIFKFVRRVVSRKLKTETYKLDDVAKEILGEGKHDEVGIENLASDWDKNRNLEKYCKYNVQDAKITYDLANVLFPNIVELVRIVGLPPASLIPMGFSQLVEWYLLRKAPEFNEVAPNKPDHYQMRERLGKTYTGAFVYEPKPGLYKDIVVFDFRSLYPSIIASHNISPATFRCKCCKENLAPVEKAEYWFCKNRKGFIPRIIEDLITRRMRVKEIMKKNEDEKTKKLLDARQESLKVLSNSFYGYLGFSAARWYSIESALSVTAYGRYYIKNVISKAEEKGFKVLYSDTDSIFLLLDNKSKEEILRFKDEINMDLPGLMELDYEGMYPSGLFVSVKAKEYGAKKKYALLSEQGFIKIKGFETVRRNWSEIAKETQEKVLRIILEKKDPQKAAEYVRDTIKKLRKKEIPIKKAVIRTQLQKKVSEYESIGPHVAVAQRIVDGGGEVFPGMVIKWVVVAGTGRVRDKAKHLEELKENETYDADYYIEHQVVPAVEGIFTILGYSREDLISDKKQSSLDGFM